MLCEETHPANYKGCRIYKELQSKKFPQLRNKQVLNPNQVSVTTVREVQPGMSYAQLARGNNLQQQSNVESQQIVQPQQPQQVNDMTELKQMLKTIMEQMSTMLNLLTALVAKGNQQ